MEGVEIDRLAIVKIGRIPSRVPIFACQNKKKTVRQHFFRNFPVLDPTLPDSSDPLLPLSRLLSGNRGLGGVDSLVSPAGSVGLTEPLPPFGKEVVGMPRVAVAGSAESQSFLGET